MAPIIKTSLALLSLSALVSANTHQPALGQPAHHGKHLKLAKRVLFEDLGKREQFAPYGYDRCRQALSTRILLLALTPLSLLFFRSLPLCCPACNLAHSLARFCRALVVWSRDTGNNQCIHSYSAMHYYQCNNTTTSSHLISPPPHSSSLRYNSSTPSQ